MLSERNTTSLVCFGLTSLCGNLNSIVHLFTSVEQCPVCFLGSALHLHPDKNEHPKAEMAFKLVAEVRFRKLNVPCLYFFVSSD